MMRAIISVVGKDRSGIMSLISSKCAKEDANIIDITQSVISGLFTMIMICELDHDSKKFIDFVDEMSKLGKDNNLDIHVMNEDIFNAMHTI